MLRASTYKSILKIRTEYLNEYHQYNCLGCNYLNTATPYAVKMISEGNTHISTCKNCGERVKLEF